MKKIGLIDGYKNLDKSYMGKEIFVDMYTLEVIGIMPGE